MGTPGRARAAVQAAETIAPARHPASPVRGVSGKIRIIVADDHPLFLDGVEHVLSLEPDFRVVARCRDGIEVLQAVREQAADLLVLDMQMPRKDGLAVLRELKGARDETPVVILTAGLNDDELVEALALGARALMLKDAEPQQLVQRVRAAHAGRRWVDERCVARVSEAVFQREARGEKGSALLTPRELEVARKVATGLRNKTIAQELCVSEGTIKIHLHNIYEKLEVGGRFGLMIWARTRGLAVL
jgi:DNA-binding NarL/FixJ family response regulator